jgi:hypothetical protein
VARMPSRKRGPGPKSAAWSAARRRRPSPRAPPLKRERPLCGAVRRSTPSAVALRAMADEPAEARQREGGPLGLRAGDFQGRDKDQQPGRKGAAGEEICCHAARSSLPSPCPAGSR